MKENVCCKMARPYATNGNNFSYVFQPNIKSANVSDLTNDSNPTFPQSTCILSHSQSLP